MSRHWLGLLLLAVWFGTGGVAHAAITAADDPLDLGNVVVGQSATASTSITADTSTPNVSVVVHGGAACAEFSIVAPTGTFTLNSGTNVAVTVKLAPTSPGAKSCAIDVKQGSLVVRSFTATGSGLAPAIRVDQPPVFSAIDVGKSTTAQLRLTNAGTSPLTITSATLAGGTEFAVSRGPTAPLAVGEQFTWNVTCQPAMFGNRTDTLAIVSDAFGDSPHNLSLSCSGNQGVLATDPIEIDFTAVPRGTTQTRTFRLSNVGSIDVGNVNLAIAPPNAGYSLDTTTVTTLARGGNATITVTFKPQSRTDGGRAAISFTGSWGSAPTPTPALSLSVLGTEASYGAMPARPALDFGVFRRDTHPEQSFQLIDDGNAALEMTASFTPAPGTGATEYQVELARGALPVTPPVTVLADDQLAVVVRAQVQAHVGVIAGHIEIASSVGEPLRVPVIGIATAAEVAFPATVEFGAVDLTRPPTTRTVTIENTSNAPFDIASIVAVDPSSGGPPSAAFAIALPVTPAHLDPGASLAVPVTYQPTAITTVGPDAVDLDARLAGGLDLGLTIQITGNAVFSEVYGGGGCNAGGTGPDGGLVLALAALIALRRRGRLVVVAAASIAVAPAVRADGIGLAVFAPTPAITGEGFALQPAGVGARGSWLVNAVVSYASNPVLLDSVSGEGRVTHALVRRSALLQLGAAYALLDRFELGARLPLYLQSGDAVAMAAAVRGTALGDLALHARARLWRGDTPAGALVAGASASVLLPTASKDQFTGSDQPEVHLLALGSITPAAPGARLTLSINGGAVLRSVSRYANIEQRSAIAWGGAASVRIVPGLWATAELFGELTPSARRPEPAAGMVPRPVTLSQIEGLAGVTIKPERRLSVGLALGRGVTGAPGSPDLRGVVSLAIVSGAAAEPIHPSAPRIAPVPDADSDGDGIIDRLDRCPRDPEDKDGFQDADGCPDLDNDGDGIPDASDQCPNDPEDRDGFEDADGCPDPDNDRDGIPDTRDRCPDEPETVNGFQDDDGCPDSVPAPAPPGATRAAEDAFARGRQLMAQNRHAAACAAFEHSQRLDPQFGTQYNLAICYDRLGRLATAWNLYRELARSDTNPARRARAGEIAAALAGRIPKLRIALPNRLDDVKVLLNGVDASALVGVDAPVDAGRYTVTATAAGYRLWQSTVEAQNGRAVTVVIELHPFP
jgi:ASPM-SPD-2-Hydin domain-containing protein/HYDIN/CFA65/VesB family protein